MLMIFGLLVLIIWLRMKTYRQPCVATLGHIQKPISAIIIQYSWILVMGHGCNMRALI
jgi:hypothetical protein